MRFIRRTPEVEEPEFQMAPMIDIIFLLLIFFMVISTFQKLEDVKGLSLPVADQSETKRSNYGEIVINVTGDGKVVFNKMEYELEELLSVLSGETGLVEVQKVTIRGDRNVPHAYIAGVMKVCQAAGIWDVTIATYQQEQG